MKNKRDKNIYTTRTTKIKLFIANAENDEDKKKLYELLRNKAYESTKARNDMMRKLWLHWEMGKTATPFTDEHGVVYTKRRFLTANRIEHNFLSGQEFNLLEYNVISDFSNDIKDVLSFKKAIRVYKDRSIPYVAAGSKLYRKKIDGKDEYFMELIGLIRNPKFVFGFTRIHKDKHLLTILDRIINGMYVLGNITLSFKDKYLYAFISYSFPKGIHNSKKEEVIAGIDLGVSVPAYISIAGKNEWRRKAFGDSQKLLNFRTQIKSRKRRLRKFAENTGHGRKRTLQAVDKLSENERNFVKDFNHKLSRKIINWCKKENVTLIRMEKLTTNCKKNKFLREYWSYYELQQHIQYKAEEIGIKVELVNPEYTSQTCHVCGYISEDNRPERNQFICQECGFGKDTFVHADFNASKNIGARTLDYKPLKKGDVIEIKKETKKKKVKKGEDKILKKIAE
jgi:putative transposase